MSIFLLLVRILMEWRTLLPPLRLDYQVQKEIKETPENKDLLEIPAVLPVLKEIPVQPGLKGLLEIPGHKVLEFCPTLLVLRLLQLRQLILRRMIYGSI
jgi:hypothetical protein